MTDLIGIWTISAVTAMASSGIRRRGRRARAHTTPITASRLRPPTRPVGHGNRAPGSVPNQLATQTSQRQGNPANAARNWPIGIRIGAVSAAPNPAIVAAATTGSARMLAGIATRLTVPEIAAITGAVTRCAAAATATDSASIGGTRRRRNPAAHVGAMTNSDPVASTDMVNPASFASVGRQTSRPSTAAASIGTASRGRPTARAINAMPDMVAARKTLGDGRATTTNAMSTSPLPTAHTIGPRRNRRNTSRTAPTMITQFVPLTASKCMSPAVRKWSASTGSSSLVSPSTRPGNRPRAGAGRVLAACRNDERTATAARCHHGAWPIRSGADCAPAIADRNPALAAGASRT